MFLWFELPEDLESEFSRLLHRHFFRNPFSNESGDNLTQREMERELRRAGPLDQSFVEAGLNAAVGPYLKLHLRLQRPARE